MSYSYAQFLSSPLPVPCGRLLGGSSAIDGMAFVQGQAQDFDTWTQMGIQGWSYEDVLARMCL